MNGFVFIETRRLAGLHMKVSEFRHFTGWPGLVVCSEKNKDLFCEVDDKMIIPEIKSLQEYNVFMTNKEFWKELPFDKVLICQHDSGILREGIDEFLEWDYVGAPWTFQGCGGNGGFSLRTRQVMYDICDGARYSASLGYEDLFFCNIMHYSNYKLAPREVCEKFSVECIFKTGTLGYHFGGDSDRFLSREQKKIILGQYERMSHIQRV